MEKWHLIELQPKLKEMFKEPPIISYKRVYILFSSRWGKFWPKVIQNRLVFKTKIQNISRYLKDFLRYLENVLGYLDIF